MQVNAPSSSEKRKQSFVTTINYVPYMLTNKNVKTCVRNWGTAYGN